MADWNGDRCGSCGAPMVWVRTAKAAMPLDAHEVRSGATERSAMVIVPLEFDDGNLVLDAGVARLKALGDEGQVLPNPLQLMSRGRPVAEALTWY